MKTIIAAGLVAIQILGASAFAADVQGENIGQTPEKSLLESLLSLQGENLSQNQFEERMRATLADYSRQASSEGQSARMERALVELRIYTPAQAHASMLDSQSATAKLIAEAQSSTDTSAVQNSVAAAMNELAALHPAGAQFSGCRQISGGLAAAGAIAAITGWVVRGDNPGCSISLSQCGVYPHRQLGNDLLIGSGVLLAAGLIVYLSSSGC